MRKEKKNTKSLKKIVFDVEDDWKCEICKRRFSAEQSMSISRRWIECDTCKKQYHNQCIPKKQ